MLLDNQIKIILLHFMASVLKEASLEVTSTSFTLLSVSYNVSGVIFSICGTKLHKNNDHCVTSTLLCL